MFDEGRGVLVLLVMLILLAPAMQGSSCNTSDTLDTIRTVHTGVREAGIRADGEIGPRLENASDACIARAEAAGFPAGSGDEGMAFWRECMEAWENLRVAVNSFRSALEELENIYQDVEAGSRGEDDWRHWAQRALDHGRTVLRFVRELDVGLDSETLTELQTQLDALCRLLGCDEEDAS